MPCALLASPASLSAARRSPLVCGSSGQPGRSVPARRRSHVRTLARHFSQPGSQLRQHSGLGTLASLGGAFWLAFAAAAAQASESSSSTSVDVMPLLTPGSVLLGCAFLANQISRAEQSANAQIRSQKESTEAQKAATDAQIRAQRESTEAQIASINKVNDAYKSIIDRLDEALRKR